MHLLLLFIPNNTGPTSIHGPFSRGRSFRCAPLAAGQSACRYFPFGDAFAACVLLNQSTKQQISSIELL